MLKRHMKRGFSLLLTLFLLVASLSACSSSYAAVKQTEEESAVICTLGKFDVTLDLWRALFLEHHGTVDGGNSSVWTGAEATRYYNELKPTLINELSDVAAVFSLCEEYGIDPYGEAINEEVDTGVAIMVEGGILGETVVEGYGSHEKYLSALKEAGLNDYVNRLLYRVSVAEKALKDEVTTETNGHLPYTEEELDTFYHSDKLAHVILLYRTNTEYSDEEYNISMANRALDAVASLSDEEQIRYKLAQYFPETAATAIENGIYVAQNELDDNYFSKVEEAIFSLEPGCFSEPISANDSVYLVYKLEKPENGLELAFEQILSDYYLHRFYTMIETRADALAEAVVFTTEGNAPDFSAMLAYRTTREE